MAEPEFKISEVYLNILAVYTSACALIIVASENLF